MRKNESVCPHCGVILDPPPKQSRKCPDCREKIILRTDPNTKDKVLLTEASVIEFDEEKKHIMGRRKILRLLWFEKDSELSYEKAESKLAEKFGSKPSPSDVYWSIANRKAAGLARNPEGRGTEYRNAQAAGMIYHQMALHLHDEGKSKARVQQVQRQGLRWLLINSQIMFAEFESGGDVSISSDVCCDTCLTSHKKQVGDLDELCANWESLPVPQEGCEFDYCNCSLRAMPNHNKKSTYVLKPKKSSSSKVASAAAAQEAGCLTSLVTLATLLFGLACLLVVVL